MIQHTRIYTDDSGTVTHVFTTDRPVTNVEAVNADNVTWRFDCRLEFDGADDHVSAGQIRQAIESADPDNGIKWATNSGFENTPQVVESNWVDLRKGA